MRVLVTGHLGYIGTVLTPMLVRAGHEVVGLDSDLYSRCTYSPGGQICDVTTIRKDVRDAVVEDLVGFDGVLHLAALSNDPLGNLKPGLQTRSIIAQVCEWQRLPRRQAFAVSCSPLPAATMVKPAKR